MSNNGLTQLMKMNLSTNETVDAIDFLVQTIATGYPNVTVRLNDIPF